jgi:hypothetical protein
MVEVLTSFCARLYGRQSARNRTLKAPVAPNGASVRRRLSAMEGMMRVMSDRVSCGAAGRRLGVSGGDIRRAGYTKVTVGRLEAWEHQPPAWLRKARARKRRSAMRRAGVSCCVCGTVREVRPRLVAGYTDLVSGPCARNGKRPEVSSQPGMILVRTVKWPDTSTGTCTGSPPPRSAPAFTGLLLWLAPSS